MVIDIVYVALTLENNTESLSERSVSASSPRLSPFAFLLSPFILYSSSPLLSSPSSHPLHPPPLVLTIGLLSSLLISLHNLLGTAPQSISSCVENAVFFICFMQISPSNTHGISKGKKEKKIYSNISWSHSCRLLPSCAFSI